MIQAFKKFFADDVKLFQIVTCMVKVSQLQSTLNNSTYWTELWQMYFFFFFFFFFFYFKKCRYMHLGGHDMNQTYTMKKGQELIKRGLWEKFGFHNISNIYRAYTFQNQNGKENLGLIFRTFTYMDKDIFMHLYKSLVRPHLEYASSVWSPVYKKPWRRTGLQLKCTETCHKACQEYISFTIQ